MMKKLAALLLMGTMTMGLLAGCSSSDKQAQSGADQDSAANAGETESSAADSSTEESSKEQAENVGEGEIVVFAAASMTETLTKIKETYEAAHPEVTITYNFDSSGTLKTQIQEGADCDLFISAGQKQMNQLDITADASVNTEGLDFVDADSRINLLENKVTLCVPEQMEISCSAWVTPMYPLGSIPRRYLHSMVWMRRRWQKPDLSPTEPT